MFNFDLCFFNFLISVNLKCGENIYLVEINKNKFENEYLTKIKQFYERLIVLKKKKKKTRGRILDGVLLRTPSIFPHKKIKPYNYSFIYLFFINNFVILFINQSLLKTYYRKGKNLH